MHRKSIVLLFLLLLGLGCAKTSDTPKGFNPEDLDQLVEIYVRSNFYNDFGLFERYQLQGKEGLRYTNAIAWQAHDTVRWQKFVTKAQAYRQKIAPEYESKKSTSAPATGDSGT